MNKQIIIEDLNQIQECMNKIYAEISYSAEPDINLNSIYHFSFKAGKRFNDIMDKCMPDRAEKIIDVDEKDIKAVN